MQRAANGPPRQVLGVRSCGIYAVSDRFMLFSVVVVVVVVVVEYYSFLIIIIVVVRDQLPACLVHVKALFSRKYCVSPRRGVYPR